MSARLSPADAFMSVGVNSLIVPVDWVPVAPGPGALARPLRAIRADTAGTVTVTTGGGSRVMNFAAGETRYIVATHVTAATATGLEGAV